MNKIKENMKKYLLIIEPEEHKYIKLKAAEMGLTVKELILYGVHELTWNRKEMKKK
ncbi:hypothetical protein LLG07_02455 [bacterium]|nr:hypothetical protein [bacterium]